MLRAAVDEPTETDVKKCVSCAKDLPDTALHCVFCGSKQPALPSPTEAPPPATAKTVMGYAAADLLKNVPKPGQPAPYQPPAPAQPQPAPYQPPAAHPSSPAYPPVQQPAPAPPSQNPGLAQTAFAPGTGPQQPQQAQPYQPPQQPYQQPYQPPQQPYQQPYQPPQQAYQPPQQGAQPPPGAQAATMFMDGSRPGMPQAAPQQQPSHPSSPMYPPAGAPSAYPPPPGPAGYPPPPGPAGYPPPPGPAGYPSTAQVPAPTPPYLASQTAARMRPNDPYAGALQLVLIIFGVVLLAAFVVPLRTDPRTVFWWDGLDEMPGKLKLMPILLAAAGLIGILLGAIPLSSMGRAAAAAGIGILALLYPALAIPEDFQWQLPVTALGSVLIPTGLLLRSAYREAPLGRILATVGAVMVIVPFLVPVNDTMPIQAAFDVLSSEVDGMVKVAAAGQIARLVIAALAFLAWIPGPSEGGAKAIAWIWIAVSIVFHFAVLLAAGDIGDGIKEMPNTVFFAGLEPLAMVKGAGASGGREGMLLAMLVPSGAVLSAYLAYASHGLATLLGKNLEG